MLNLSVLLAKVEAVAGTPVVPVGATDAYLVQNMRITPFKSTPVRRNVDLPFAGARGAVPTAIHQGLSFDVELCGSGAANTAAKWGNLLQSCLFAAAAPGGAEVTYALSSAGDGFAMSAYSFKDTARHRGYGMRGTVTFSFVEKQLPKMSFDMLALILSNIVMDNTAPGAVTLPSYPAPAEVNLANTVVTLDGYVVGCRSLEINMGMKTVFYSTTGGKAVIFDKSDDGDRRAARFKAVFELPDPATKNYFTGLPAGTAIAFSIVHGTVAGNIVDMSSPGLVIETAEYTDENNRLFMSIEGALVPTAANNELVLKTR